MAPDLDSYLATRYLVADSKPTKKRKRKQPSNEVGLLITEDDESGFGASAKQDEDEDGPAVVAGTSAEFRKAKKSSWKTLGAAAKEPSSREDADVANAIIASAAAEQEASRQADDEGPTVENSSAVVMMGDGTHAGLQSAAAVTAQLEKRKREERKEFERLHGGAKEEETAYRDAAGNRIDISMRRAQARRAAAEAAEKERLAKDALKGDTQKEEAQKRREALEDAKLMPFARGVEDAEMNRELKEQQRWNDPMMQFLGDRRGQAGTATSKAKKGRPSYNGPVPPNRYGIRPGYRWDGVDRSNGFESERFRALNRREMKKDLEYSWQMDV
ncbi:related to Pre-mRNA-splicing factor CWC26 [Cephalotrichum gorgonifer]|uniref:Related to Pre-mRNA-splicing factor CWC26 n=1 Tax=Cephalotrichum gorgonifer TaxID=2041049 RepID=A0AAE8SW40_9PEZI|nr:related to Pre-mRNA-splicing factor CWC26 [Cephalotrichum gorgonifer]